MPVLESSKHEQFAQHVAKGVSATKAYVLAGYSEKGAGPSACRMLRNASISARVAELQDAIATEMLQRSIHDVNCRLAAQQDRWLKLQQLIAERAAAPEMEGVPGGRTGLVVLRKRAVGSGKASRSWRRRRWTL